MSHEAICIIPARGGSKGVPRKNVIPVFGRPLIAWSIEQALASASISRVIVTTDDDEIADVSSDWGAEVFRRSPTTATDTATSESALVEVLESLNHPPEVTVFLQATSPIRQPGDIDRCVEMVRSRYDSGFSCRDVEGYTWSECDGMIRPAYVIREPRQIRRVRVVEENGSIYVFCTKGFLRAGVRLFGRIAMVPMHPLDSFQIDNPSDIVLMESLMLLRCGHVLCHVTAS